MAKGAKGGDGFGLTLDVVGMEEAQAMMLALQKIAKASSRAKGADFVSATRKDGDTTNGEVMSWLKEGGRDFRTASDSMKRAVAKEFARIVEETMRRHGVASNKLVAAKAASKAKQLPPNMAKAGVQAQMLADQAAGKAYHGAMDTYRRLALERLETGVSNDGQKHNVSPEYAKQRQRDHGVSASVVGKATGQLLEALADRALIRVRSAATN